MKEIYKNYFITKDSKVYNKHNKIMSPADNGKGYLILNLRVDGGNKCKAIHRLVAEAFIPNPLNLPEVNHIDGNRQNNSVENLEWITHGNNIKHSYILENRSATGSNNANATIDETKAEEICVLLEEGLSSAKIRDEGYPYTIVRQIKQRRTWKHVSCKYNF